MPIGVFVLTDIEGSTRLWADHPAEMGSALARHDELLCGAVEEAGGEMFKHTGDGVCAVFPSVSNAVEAVAAAQRGLGSHDWGSIGHLRVRMAIHAGEAEQRGGDWFGPALNRVARLMGIGHGSQVLLSGAAHELVSDRLLERFSFVDLGSHRLRDLTRPEHVWQLVGEGLERSFPPLRSFDGYRGRLPAQTTSFIGRQKELDDVTTELASARLVTLVGPGGVGKTRLAVQVGVGLVDKFADGVWMFELAGLNGPDGLEASMLATLGRAGTSIIDPRQELLTLVSSWRALLILDNCEHLIGPVTDLARDLLGAGAGLTVLATSREPLHVPGERVVPVAPLPVADDAVALFVDRATALRPSFELEGEEREAVERVCRHLDGMPLAIELAAARTVAMTPGEIDRRLDQRFRLLSVRSGAGDRHASLQRAVDWSYDLLGDGPRALFCRLSVFTGNFDIEAAHAVSGVEDEFTTMDMLAELVDKSLVTATPQASRTAYRLLETMRQYGADRLASSEKEQLGHRHGEYFAGLAERSWDGLRGYHSRHWMETLDIHFDNMRAAFENALLEGRADRAVTIAGGLFMFNHSRRSPELYGWVDRALTLPGADRQQFARHALLHRAFSLYMANDLSGAEREARGVLDRTGDDTDALRPMILCTLATPIATMGRLEEGEQASQEALDLARRGGIDHDYEQAEALWILGVVAVFRGAPDRDLARELLALARRLGNHRALASGLLMSGMAEPDLAVAAELLAEARDVTARSRDGYRHALATAWLRIVTSRDDPRADIQTIQEMVDYARSTGQHVVVHYVGRHLLSPLVALGRYDATAVLDGALGPVAFTDLGRASDAVAAAREALGADEYTQLAAIGQAFSPSDLEDYLLRLAEEFP